ncbi:hypothetical protein HYE29_00705 [Mycoplasmopsis bovis]|nr:hypothetical protein [Mycoplasmopsis bovis]QQH22716.1 hypothetical protein HYE29_00705 [Mycoplasmopsis bovis]
MIECLKAKTFNGTFQLKNKNVKYGHSLKTRINKDNTESEISTMKKNPRINKPNLRINQSKIAIRTKN